MPNLARLEPHGLKLLPIPSPIGNFRNYIRTGSLIFISGQGPREADGTLHEGKVGIDVTTAAAYEHAKLTGLNLLSVLADAIGDLGRVSQVVKLLGLVNAADNFTNHPEVINGCSDLFTAVFGEIGQHARSAIGVSSLPNNITVEIEAIFELRA
ncbi:RidA family protein [Devosia psychrophila]|uniref:Enamine deaminase RidA, house cleaning of reactive enamine intermediates, YjgF/YER057c/UK114 family n=1 Tax=Devosia psychrophila TaxID=728005 RepID=A0A0F5Q0J2_9HYPH|nr:RidA family protein [Devosia psychrophila]KKC34395.1 endoribonuclease L-PSP [Devosia psychrophila]SFD43598.1 Enamine deaminase RidA, house cleaning of reactive enamine intermediates, YjgF/YER057c/UK114 family [Devosia psychrophila]